MIVVRQGQRLYYVPPEQNGPMQWQVGAAPPSPQIQLLQPTLRELIVDALGKLVVAGVTFGVVYAGWNCFSGRMSALCIALIVGVQTIRRAIVLSPVKEHVSLSKKRACAVVVAGLFDLRKYITMRAVVRKEARRCVAHATSIADTGATGKSTRSTRAIADWQRKRVAGSYPAPTGVTPRFFFVHIYERVDIFRIQNCGVVGCAERRATSCFLAEAIRMPT